MNSARTIVFAAAVCLLLAAGSARAGTLVGYWTFDNNPLDSSGNTNDATLYNGVGYDPAGRFGAALSLDGSNDYALVPGSPSLNITPYTVSVWIRPTLAGEHWTGIVGRPGRYHNAWFGRSNNSAGGYIHHRFSAGGNWNAYAPDAYTVPIDGSTWTHVVIANDGATARTYLDGSLVTKGAVASPLATSSGHINIGRHLDNSSTSTATNGAFHGLIDDLAIWDGALDPAGVFALSQGTATPQALPRQIQANSQAADTYLPDGRRARRLIDGAGLIADNDGDGIDQHGITPGHTMWLTNNATPSTDRWVKFQLDGLYSLDAMRIWNYNEPGGYLGRQVQTALVQYSTDGIHWTTLGGGPRTMKTTADGLTSYDDVEHVSFGDAPVRFVRLGNPANPLVQVVPGLGHLGLSEVQFFGDPLPEHESFLVTQPGVNASSQYPGREAVNAVNGSGLTPDSDGDGVDEHNTTVGDMWLSAVGDTTPWITFDLGSDTPLWSMRVWNSNEINLSSRSVKTADIKYAVEGQVGDLSDPDDPGWTLLAADVPLTRADELGGYEAVDEFFFGPAGVMARHVLIDVQSNYGDGSHAGLSEVQFFRIPEPSSLSLSALGLLGLVLAGRRRKR